jgi:Uncharacterized protein conserved in bacteria
MLISFALVASAHGNERPWILVDTETEILLVIQGGKMLQTFKNIAIGRNGASRERYSGDGHTPLGVFHVLWINRNSPFYLFFGLNYPNLEYAASAYLRGVIDFNTLLKIRYAEYHHLRPPQDTPLGGFIGIHGLGNANPYIHRRTNWTRGCIALTNVQIRTLARWVKIGTRVVIR